VLHALFSVRARSLVASKMGNRFRRGGPEQLAARDWVSRTCLEQLAAQDRCRMPVWSSWLLRIGVACLFGAAGCSGSVSHACLEQLAAQDRCRIPVWSSWLLEIGVANLFGAAGCSGFGGSRASRSSWLLGMVTRYLFGAAGCSGSGGQGPCGAAGCSGSVSRTCLEQLAARDRWEIRSVAQRLRSADRAGNARSGPLFAFLLAKVRFFR